jgi:uncharacterized protein YodC (DUF2158 family)
VADKFKVGDVVALRSGGVLMTVQVVGKLRADSLDGEAGLPACLCRWIDAAGHVQQRAFDQRIIVLARAPAPARRAQRSDAGVYSRPGKPNRNRGVLVKSGDGNYRRPS